jgi:hypothetical protein
LGLPPSRRQVRPSTVVGMEPVGWPSLLLREVARPPDREAALDLLVGAGWSRPWIAEWALRGTLFELYDPADGLPVAAAIVAPAGGGNFELVAWATSLGPGDAVVARRLVRAVADAVRAVGGRRVRAAVGDGRVEQVKVLLEAGFRFDRVEGGGLSPRGSGLTAGSGDLIWVDQEL